MTSDRLQRQLAFIVEIDKAKSILRNSLVIEEGRRENDAEHAWHLAVMARLLAEYARDEIDIDRVIEMLLVHDLVEIDAGDTFIYDTAARERQAEKERAAADRIFGLLPPDQAAALREPWEEFEARQTPEAKFAFALDRLQPLLLNFHTQGHAWRKHGVRQAQVIAVNSSIADGAPELWEYARGLIDEAVRRGYLSE
ncbi:MAG: HD domain-containing protein [Chloroflexi bacterium]|nr:HD domain-containing protein [Chloroflexota bacterium]